MAENPEQRLEQLAYEELHQQNLALRRELRRS